MASIPLDPRDPLGSLSDPYWKRQEELETEHDVEFNNGVREITILVLTGILLFLGSRSFLNVWRRRRDRDEEFLPFSREDEIVYKISFGICSFSLAVSVGAALLLPVSTISNEVLHRYPSSWYIKWLNTSLIQGIWNVIFLLSNFSLFLFLPFAYLFCESEGLPFFGNKRGLMARAKETMVTLLLLSLTVLGMLYVLEALVDREDSIGLALNVYSYLPFLYSCVSFVGVLLLLLCTPLGFARLFALVGDLVIKPNFMRNLDEEFYTAKFEEDCLRQRLVECRKKHGSRLVPLDVPSVSPRRRRYYPGAVDPDALPYYEKSLLELGAQRRALDRARRTPLWRRILGYPLVLLALLTLTTASLICVISNVMQIIVGFRTLPSKQDSVDLGLTSISTLGAVGVIIEVLLLGYLFLTSLVGLYTIPLIRDIKPTVKGTSLTQLILNCGLFLILSSALPLLAKILGITNFDLLGSFGEVKWLGNLYIVLLYNAVFAFAATTCLITHFTARVRREIGRRFALAIHAVVPVQRVKESWKATASMVADLRERLHFLFKWNFLRRKLATTPAVTAASTGLKAE